MPRKSNKNQQGFTIIELLIATLVFSVLLIGMLAAFIRIGDLFYKGVSMSKTQEDARNIVQTISDDIQFTAGAPEYPSTVTVTNGDFKANISQNSSAYFCVANHRYRYQIGAQVGQASNYGISSDDVGTSNGCPSPVSVPPKNAINGLLDSGMQLNQLEINCAGGRVAYCTVNIHVIFYGGSHSGLFTSSTNPSNPWLGPDAQCIGSLNDTSLCATVDYDSTVLEG